MSSSIELSFNTDISRGVLLDLRDQLRMEIPGIDFNLREPAMQPGKMGVQWADLFMHAAVISTSEVLLLSLLEPAAEGIAHKIKTVRDKFVREKNLGRLDISGSVKAGDRRMSFKIAGERDVQYFDESPYSIDPEHTFVLLVGCGKYADVEILDIPPVEQNLMSLRELVLDKQYFAIPPQNVTVSLNDSDGVIRRLLHQCSRQPGIDTFLFYYVGHGFCTGSDKYYLAASNTEKDNDFINWGIEKEFIKEDILLRSPAKQKIAIVDACYSGLLTQGGEGIFGREVTGSYVLTSSSADEVSFYDKEQPYTFFTGALVHAVKNGLRNDAETISLDDLYSETAAEMRKRKLQQPTFKNGLNITPANFIVAHNAAYSEESEIVKINALATTGKYREAELMVQKMIQKFPGNEKLKRMALQISNDRMYSELTHEGDSCFFVHKDYRKAAECYRQAYELKMDVAVRDKLLKCQAYFREYPAENEPPQKELVKTKLPPVIKQAPPSQPPVTDRPVIRQEEDHRKWYKRVALLLAVFGAVVIGLWLENRGKGDVGHHDTDVIHGIAAKTENTGSDQSIAKYVMAHWWSFSERSDGGGGGSILSFKSDGTVNELDDSSVLLPSAKVFDIKWRIESGILYINYASKSGDYNVSYIYNSTSDISGSPVSIKGVGHSSLDSHRIWEMTILKKERARDDDE